MAQQFIGAGLPGDPAQRPVRQPQFLGRQPHPLGGQLDGGGIGMRPGRAQLADLARARAEFALAGLRRAAGGELPQCRVQVVQGLFKAV